VGVVNAFRRRPSLALAIFSAALIVPATACSGSSADKAGGTRRADAKPKPVTLTLFTQANLFAPEYAAAVARLSGGAMRIRIAVGGNQPDYERSTVRYVRSGRAQLGGVGARVWDTMGVTSLRALVAPFLVDSLALEERVLESPRVQRMLKGVDKTGVVGLAVLPGPLRRPLGLSRPLAGPDDYRGATIAIRYGDVARKTFAALGATTKGYNVGVLPAAADGAELDVNTIGLNTYDVHAKGLTSNVVLWVRPETIFANRQAFERLTPAQQQILRRAGREALVPELARITKDDQAALSAICRRGTLTLATASASDLAALRRAVRPVYAELNKDPFTKALISEIAKLRIAPTDVIQCPSRASRPGAASVLEGRWQATSSTEDLLAAGTPPAEAERQRGVATLELRGGRWIARERHSGFVWRGPYTVKGDILYLTIADCRAPAGVCFGGITSEYTWSVYRDRLTLDRLSGTPTYYGLLAKPLTRLR
jgi:TRAP-type C4-dicarboxylate transport system substrate-binding protein